MATSASLLPPDDKTDLSARLRSVQDEISLSKSSHLAAGQRFISSSIGAETPIGVLAEIREAQYKLIDEMKKATLMEQEIEKRNQDRHTELCSILLAIAETRSDTRSASNSVSAFSSREAESKHRAFYGSHAITNGTYLAACILMHIDAMLQAHPRFKKIQGADTTYLSIKDWFTMCTSALNADKNSKVGLRLPKPTDGDFIAASKIVASSVQGRQPQCDSTHIAILLSECPALMNTVEWLRSALVRCTGVLSPERTCRLRLLPHPFVNESGELLVEKVDTLRMPNKFMYQDIAAMKITDRKEYMRLVLECSVRPADAVGRIKIKQ